MKKLSVLLILAVSLLFISANSRTSELNYEIATVDTAPGVDGYFSRSVNASTTTRDNVTFFIAGSGTMTVTIQFNSPATNTWTDYATYTTATRVKIGDGSKTVLWRAGVKNGDHTSGSLTFGFDW